MFDFFKWVFIYLGVGFFLNFVVTILFLKEFIIFVNSLWTSERKKKILNKNPKTVAFLFSIFGSPIFFFVLIPALFGKNPFVPKIS